MSEADEVKVRPEIIRNKATVQYRSLIKFRIHPESRELMAKLRACNGKQVLHDDHAAEYASLRPVLERLLCGPSDEDDMALLDITFTGQQSDEANIQRYHEAMVQAQIRVLTDSHGFAAVVSMH